MLIAHTGSVCIVVTSCTYDRVTALNSHVEVLLHYCLNVFLWEESTNYNTVDRSTQRWNKRSPVTATDERRPTRWNASGYLSFSSIPFSKSEPQSFQNTTASVHFDLNSSPVLNSNHPYLVLFNLKCFKVSGLQGYSTLTQILNQTVERICFTIGCCSYRENHTTTNDVAQPAGPLMHHCNLCISARQYVLEIHLSFVAECSYFMTIGRLVQKQDNWRQCLQVKCRRKGRYATVRRAGNLSYKVHRCVSRGRQLSHREVNFHNLLLVTQCISRGKRHRSAQLASVAAGWKHVHNKATTSRARGRERGKTQHW